MRAPLSLVFSGERRLSRYSEGANRPQRGQLVSFLLPLEHPYVKVLFAKLTFLSAFSLKTFSKM